jgi:hypothetical protein
MYKILLNIKYMQRFESAQCQTSTIGVKPITVGVCITVR